MARFTEADRQISVHCGATLKERDIRRFFEELDQRLHIPIEIVLTGGAAAILRGVQRATYDIDFELHLKRSHSMQSKNWDDVQKAITETEHSTNLKSEYAADIERWSAISFPTKKGEPFAKIGKIDLQLLEPGIWAIGKLARYLASDVKDLRTGLKTAKTNPKAMARLWGVALGMSPMSNAHPLFSRQVISFINKYAKEIWGSSIRPDELQQLFLESARRTKAARRPIRNKYKI